MGGVVSGGPAGLGFAPMMGPMFAQNSDGTMSDAGKQLMTAGSLPSATRDSSQWGLWTKVFGSRGENDGDDIASQYDYDAYGISLGFDKKIGAQSLLGVAIGYAVSNTEMDKIDEDLDVDSYHASVYGVFNPDPWYVAGIVSYALHDYDSERKIRLTGEKLEADYDGNTISAYVEGGYRWGVTKYFDIIPMASFQVSYLETDSFKEKGGPSALDVDDNDYTSLVSTLGVRVRHEFVSAGGARFIPEFRVRWAHEFGNDDYSSNAGFVYAPSAKFKVEGDDPEDDAALLGVGFTAVMKNNLSFYIDYDAMLSGDFTEHTGALGLRYRW
jgi:outer membrane autotransporter protein